jgi:hypothetical protein
LFGGSLAPEEGGKLDPVEEGDTARKVNLRTLRAVIQRSNFLKWLRRKLLAALK